MLRALAAIALNGIGVWLVARLVPGVHFEGDVVYLLLTGLVIGIINVAVRPLVTLFSLPFIFVTLGLFYLVINGTLFVLADVLLSGLTVDGCLPAILGGFALAVFNCVLRGFGNRDTKDK